MNEMANLMNNTNDSIIINRFCITNKETQDDCFFEVGKVEYFNPKLGFTEKVVMQVFGNACRYCFIGNKNISYHTYSQRKILKKSNFLANTKDIYADYGDDSLVLSIQQYNDLIRYVRFIKTNKQYFIEYFSKNFSAELTSDDIFMN